MTDEADQISAAIKDNAMAIAKQMRAEANAEKDKPKSKPKPKLTVDQADEPETPKADRSDDDVIPEEEQEVTPPLDSGMLYTIFPCIYMPAIDRSLLIAELPSESKGGRSLPSPKQLSPGEKPTPAPRPPPRPAAALEGAEPTADTPEEEAAVSAAVSAADGAASPDDVIDPQVVHDRSLLTQQSGLRCLCIKNATVRVGVELDSDELLYATRLSKGTVFEVLEAVELESTTRVRFAHGVAVGWTSMLAKSGNRLLEVTTSEITDPSLVIAKKLDLVVDPPKPELVEGDLRSSSFDSDGSNTCESTELNLNAYGQVVYDVKQGRKKVTLIDLSIAGM